MTAKELPAIGLVVNTAIAKKLGSGIYKGLVTAVISVSFFLFEGQFSTAGFSYFSSEVFNFRILKCLNC